MLIMGVDYHPSFQQIAFFVEETGECGERLLNHSEGEAEKFYRDLKLRGVDVRVGMEATGHARWFERLLAETWIRVVDWRSSPGQGQTRAEAKNRPRRCSAFAEIGAGRSLSTDLGTQSGESRSSATAVASASAGADADADHESAASAGNEREPVLEGEALERTRASRIGKASVSLLGQPPSARVVGTLGSDES